MEHSSGGESTCWARWQALWSRCDARTSASTSSDSAVAQLAALSALPRSCHLAMCVIRSQAQIRGALISSSHWMKVATVIVALLAVQARQFAARYVGGVASPRTLQGSRDWALPVATHGMLYTPTDLAFVLYLAHHFARLAADSGCAAAGAAVPVAGDTEGSPSASAARELSELLIDSMAPAGDGPAEGANAASSSAPALHAQVGTAADTENEESRAAGLWRTASMLALDPTAALAAVTPQARAELLTRRVVARLQTRSVQAARRFLRIWRKVCARPSTMPALCDMRNVDPRLLQRAHCCAQQPDA